MNIDLVNHIDIYYVIYDMASDTTSEVMEDEGWTVEQKEALANAFEYAKQITESLGINSTKRAMPIVKKTDSLAVAQSQVKDTGSVSTLSILCRIYIGSIGFELTESDVKKAFSPFGVVKSIFMPINTETGRHKGYCFLEYETPDAAALALEKMNGSELVGRTIKVGRSSNFPSILPPGLAKPLPQRLYLSNVHQVISERDLMDVFSSFGSVNKCILMKSINNGVEQHKNYGYVEFKDEATAKLVLESMKGLQLVGQELFIGPTVIGGDLPGTDVNESYVLVLGDMLTIDEFSKDPEEAKDILHDISEECSKVGHVSDITNRIRGTMVDFLVSFKDQESCKKAVQIFDKRFFATHRINAYLLPKTNLNPSPSPSPNPNTNSTIRY
jgi:RNA recognition motif-containing protein